MSSHTISFKTPDNDIHVQCRTCAEKDQIIERHEEIGYICYDEILKISYQEQKGVLKPMPYHVMKFTEKNNPSLEALKTVFFKTMRY